MDSGQPSEAERKRSYYRVRSATAAIDVLRPGGVETAMFLLGEVKAGYDHKVAESANLESKATTSLGIVAGATSILGVFGTRDGKIVVTTPLVIAAMMCVLAALVCLLYILRAKWFGSPRLGSYISAAMVREDNRLGLILTVAETYRFLRDEFERTLRSDRHALFIAYAAIATASILLLVNVVNTNGTVPVFHSGGTQKAGTQAPAPNGPLR